MLAVKGLYKTFRTEHEEVNVLKGVDFTIEQGKLYGLLGPSGCGKSTILRSVAGLETPTEGEISIDGEVVYSSKSNLNVQVHKRQIGMVFQSYAIWPHMDVFHNVAFPLMHGERKYSKEDIKRRVNEALKMVQLEGKEDRPAPLLSGGQQQRVALARALVYKPKLLLLDEPLSNLDAKLRVEMRKEIRRLVNEFNITTLFVTHDQSEALSLSDRIAVLNNGVILQEGTPEELYTNPQSSFVAKFVGNSNLLQGHIIKGEEGEGGGIAHVQTEYGVLRGRAVRDLAAGTPVFITIRPEAVQLGTDKGESELNELKGRVEGSMFTGDTTECQFMFGSEVLELKFHGLQRLKAKEELSVYIPPERCAVFARDVEPNLNYKVS